MIIVTSPAKKQCAIFLPVTAAALGSKRSVLPKGSFSLEWKKKSVVRISSLSFALHHHIDTSNQSVCRTRTTRRRNGAIIHGSNRQSQATTGTGSYDPHHRSLVRGRPASKLRARSKVWRRRQQQQQQLNHQTDQRAQFNAIRDMESIFFEKKNKPSSSWVE